MLQVTLSNYFDVRNFFPNILQLNLSSGDIRETSSVPHPVWTASPKTFDFEHVQCKRIFSVQCERGIVSEPNIAR